MLTVPIVRMVRWVLVASFCSSVSNYSDYSLASRRNVQSDLAAVQHIIRHILKHIIKLLEHHKFFRWTNSTRQCGFRAITLAGRPGPVEHKKQHNKTTRIRKEIEFRWLQRNKCRALRNVGVLKKEKRMNFQFAFYNFKGLHFAHD